MKRMQELGLKASVLMFDNNSKNNPPLLLTHNNPTYNWVYKRLVSSENDLVGAIAYVLYKEHKIEFILKVESETGGDPTPEQWSSFHQHSCLESSLAGFQKRAEDLVNEFLKGALTSHAEYIETQADERMEERVKLATQDLKNQIVTLQNQITSNYQTIATEISNKKSKIARLGEAFYSIIYGVIALMLIGGGVVGYNAVSKFMNNTETVAGLK